MDNKIQSTYGGVSNPSGPARWVRDAVGIGTGPIGDAAKSMAKEVERRHEEPVKAVRYGICFSVTSPKNLNKVVCYVSQKVKKIF